MKLNIIWFALAFCAFSLPCTAYKGGTHEQINEFVLDSNLVYIDDILINRLGYTKGINTKINGKELIDWLKAGGSLEDEPINRAFNHFLDPTDSSGSGFPMTVTADDWALNKGGVQNPIIWLGNMSWPAAAEYFRIAVTGRDSSGDEVAVTQAERDSYLARAFRALGQVMHLVEDMSVPAHTRNDMHPPWDDDPYEVWCDNHESVINGILDAQSSYFLPSSSDIGALAGVGFAPIARIPINDIQGLFDEPAIRGQYCGPDAQGMAEYSNCNFGSRDALANSRFEYYRSYYHKYPYPQFPQLTFEGVNSANDEIYSYRTHIDEWGIKIDPYVVEVNPGQGIPSYFTMTGDCLYAHAKVLIPKAASYSSRVLELFFKYHIEPFTSSGRVSSYKKFIRRYKQYSAEPDVTSILEGEYAANYSSQLYGIAPDGRVVDAYDQPNPKQMFTLDAEPPVVPALVTAALEADPDSMRGRSVQDGVTVRLMQPKARPEWNSVPLEDGFGNPKNPDPGSVDKFELWGCADDGTEVLLQAGREQWPSFAPFGPTPTKYKRYRIKFSGTVEGVATKAETCVNETVEDFDLATPAGDSCFGGGLGATYCLTYPYAPCITAPENVSPLPEGLQVANGAFTYAGQGQYVLQISIPNNCSSEIQITRDSVFVFDISSASQNCSFTVRLNVAEDFCDNSARIAGSMDPEVFGNKTLGELFPNFFQNNETYTNPWIDLLFGGQDCNFSIDNIGLLP